MSDKSLRVWLSGSSGRMGLLLQDLIVEANSGFLLVGGNNRLLQGSMLHKGELATPQRLAQAWQDVDLVIDFSLPDGVDLICNTLDLIKQSQKTAPAILICTTGLSDLQLKRIKTLGKTDHRILRAPNTSVGILALRKILQVAMRELSVHGFDASIIETHHRHKKDKPSGTALLLKEALLLNSSNELNLPIESIRGGQVYGEHEVKFLGDFEELIITHRAGDRKIFARGALRLGQWLGAQRMGYYELDDVKFDF